MLKRLSMFGLVGVLVLVGGGVSTAIAGNNISSPETLVLTETQTKSKVIDAGKHGFGPGDVFLFTSSLTDKADGSKVGTLHGQCTVQIGRWQMCEVGVFIGDRGQFVVAGVVEATDQPTAFDLPITGGTGEFDNVRGSVNVDPVSDTVSTDTVTLIP
jgi:Dirigent-like protein